MARRRDIKKWFMDNKNKHLCECGCGKYIKLKKYYRWTGIPKTLHGHNINKCQPKGEKCFAYVDGRNSNIYHRRATGFVWRSFNVGIKNISEDIWALIMKYQKVREEVRQWKKSIYIQQMGL